MDLCGLDLGWAAHGVSRRLSRCKIRPDDYFSKPIRLLYTRILGLRLCGVC